MTTLAKVFAAMTLLVAAFVFAPVSDAIACAPEVPSVHQLADHAYDDHSLPDVEHGLCSHGHCHHSASERHPGRDFIIVAPNTYILKAPLLDDAVPSFVADGLKRPPRI